MVIEALGRMGGATLLAAIFLLPSPSKAGVAEFLARCVADAAELLRRDQKG
jgi:hypothetical protein